MSDARSSQPPLDFRFLDLMIILLVVTGGVALLVLVLAPGTESELRILSGTIPDAATSRAYDLQFFATGGQPPYDWQAHNTPDGLQLRKDGLLSGVPRKAGTYHLSLAARDRSATLATAEALLHVTEGGSARQPLQINTRVLPPGYVGRTYSLTLAAEGGIPPYEWAVTGLPKGLASDGALITGEPSEAGVAGLQIHLSDADRVIAGKEIDLQIISDLGSGGSRLAPDLTVTSPMPPMIQGRSYSLQLSANGGTPPYQWKPLSITPGVTVTSGGLLRVERPEDLSDGWSTEVKVYDSGGQAAVGELFPVVIKSHVAFRWFIGIAVATAWIVIIVLLRSLSAHASNSLYAPRRTSLAVATCALLGLVATAMNWDAGGFLFLLAAIGVSILSLLSRVEE